MQLHRTCFLLCIKQLTWVVPDIAVFNPFRTHCRSYCFLPWVWKEQACPHMAAHSNTAHFNPEYRGRIFLRNVGNTADYTRCYNPKIGYTLTLKFSVLQGMCSDVSRWWQSKPFSYVWSWRSFVRTYCPIPTEAVCSPKPMVNPTRRHDIVPVPWTEKTIERSPFFFRRGGHCCRGDLVGRTNFWILSEWFENLEQRAKKCIELCGEYVE